MPPPATYRRAYPSDATLSEWVAADGWQLRRFDWPALGTPRGAILFQGGRADFFEKSLESLAHWHGQGWAVTAFDWRGQGGSGRLAADPRVGHLTEFTPLLADLARFWAEWTRSTPAPHVAMGHSMGGHLVLRALVERAIDPTAAVLIAPILGLNAPFGWHTGGELLAALMARFGNPARAAWRDELIPGGNLTRQALLTHDPERYADEAFWKRTRPDLAVGPPSWAWVREAFRSARLLRTDARLPATSTPVLALIADADRLVNAKAAMSTLARLPGAEVVRFGSEAAHEILREADPVRDQALAAIDAFLAKRAPRP